ncbi:hypothetical protein Agau_P200451 (plasmid) [Agrobacterium tumefaciens F2]|nr:hypothetical protein Agau_P200451 [Agrobacterium tumefaciens F2]
MGKFPADNFSILGQVASQQLKTEPENLTRALHVASKA